MKRRAPRRARAPAKWIKPGARADYHAVIGGEVTAPSMLITTEPSMMCGSWVVWLEGKAGCVAVEALTRVK